jgi:hypothetical protein
MLPTWGGDFGSGLDWAVAIAMPAPSSNSARSAAPVAAKGAGR